MPHPVAVPPKETRHDQTGPPGLVVPGPGEVLLRITASGLCHSDEFVMMMPEEGYPYPMPMTLGHEPAGVVEELGDGEVHEEDHGDTAPGTELTVGVGRAADADGARRGLCVRGDDGHRVITILPLALPCST